MRTIGILLVLVLWLLLGWKMCNDFAHCCGSEDVSAAKSGVMMPDKTKMASNKNCSEGLICFADNSCEVAFGGKFERFRDSLISLVTSGKQLQITGIYTPSETYEGSSSNLGVCRANTIRNSFGQLKDDQIITNDQLTVGRNPGATERVRLDIVDVKSTQGDLAATDSRVGDTKSSSAKDAEAKKNGESSTRTDGSAGSSSTVIYFPFNSTNKLNDGDVERYLNQIAEKVRISGASIYLTGHTDDIGSTSSNKTLGQRRANIIADYLMGQGVRRAQIRSESKGESEPVASNATEVGRAKNRRTELKIIQ